MDHQFTEKRGVGRPLAWIIWALAVTYVAYKFQTQSSYAVLNAGIAESLGLSLGQIGTLGAVYSVTYAVMTLVVGGLLDRYGARRVLGAGVAIVALGAMIFGLANSLAAVAVGQALLGIGGAFGFPGLAYLTRYWFEVKHFGLVFGIAQTVAATANTLGQAGVGYLVLLFAWQEIMLLEAGFGLFLLVLFLVFVREPRLANGESESRNPGRFWPQLVANLKRLTGDRLMWQVTLISGITFGTVLGVGIIWGIKLLQTQGFDATTASNINSTLWFGFGIGALLVHVVADALRSFRVTSIIFLMIDLLAATLIVSLDEMPLLVAYALYVSLGFFAGVSTLCFTMTTRFCAKAIAGTAFGFITSVSFVVAAVLMAVPGKAVESAGVSLGVAAYLFPSALLLALLIAIVKKETYSMAPPPDAG